MVYGQSREEAIAKVKALALRVLADRLEQGESIPELNDVFAVPASESGWLRDGVGFHLDACDVEPNGSDIADRGSNRLL